MDPETKPKSKLWTFDFIRVGIARLFYSISVQILQTIYPIYLNLKGFSASSIGTVATIYTACSMIMRFISGQQVDTKGRRKVGITGGLFLFGGVILCLLAVFFEPVLGASIKIPGGKLLSLAMIVIIIGRMGHGFGNAAINISNTTMFADILPPDRFAEGMGYSGLFNSLSTAIGPAIGLFLIGISAKLTFGALAASSLICVLLTASMKYESDPGYLAKAAKEDAVVNTDEKYTGIWLYFEKRSVPAAIILFILSVSSAANTNFLALYAKSIGLAGVGYYYTYKAACMVLMRLIAGRLSDKFGSYKTIFAGLTLVSAAFFGLSFINSSLSLYTWALIDGLGCGLAYPALSVLTLNGVPRKRRGIANATYLISWDVGLGVGAMLWGMLIDAAGSYSIVYTIAGTALAVDVLISIVLSRKYPEAKRV